MKKKDSYLVTKDVAKLTGLATSTVKNYCRLGKISALKVGNRYFVTVDEVMSVIKNGFHKEQKSVEEQIDTEQGLLFPPEGQIGNVIDVDWDGDMKEGKVKTLKTIKSLLNDISESLQMIVKAITKNERN